MKIAKFERFGQHIKDLESEIVTDFKTCNLAKKQSRNLQPRSGDGTVRVRKS